MQNNFDHSLDLVLKSEGGYVDNPKDPGGITNLGVTAKVWATYKGRSTTHKEMKNLTRADVAPLYEKKYWDACNCDELPSGIDYLVFDFAVNAGTGRSIKTLQKVLNVPEDGHIGNVTIQNVEIADKSDLVNKFSEAKKEFYSSLSTFPTFGKGWFSRVDQARVNASGMIG
jgi:lysozyme family protein